MRHRLSGSLRQTMRKRLRCVGPPESLGPLTQVTRPVVAAKSPDPMVESATISIDEIAVCSAAARKAARPWIVGTPGALKTASSVYQRTQAVGSASSKAAASAISAARMAAVSDGESVIAEDLSAHVRKYSALGRG